MRLSTTEVVARRHIKSDFAAVLSEARLYVAMP